MFSCGTIKHMFAMLLGEDMDKFIVPPGIRVSPHAAARYLTRVLKIPVTPRWHCQ